MNRLKRIIKTTVWSIAAAYIAVVIMVRIPFVQNWLGNKASSLIAQKFGTKASVGKVHLGFLNRLIIDDLELYDKRGKLMVSTSRLAAKIDYGQLIRNGRILVSSAQVFGFNGKFYKTDSLAKPNFQFVLDSLASKDTNKKSDLELSVNSLIIRHGAIKYDIFDKTPTPSRFNTSHLDIRDISAHIIIPYYTADSAAVSLKKLSLKEASGLDLRKLSFDLEYDGKGALLTDFNLSLPRTNVNINRLEAEYNSKDGKPDFTTLRHSGTMGSSTVTPGDIACFVPALKNFTTPLYVSTTFDGTASYMNISAAGIRTADNGIRLEGSGKIRKNGRGLEWKADISSITCTEKGINNILDRLPGDNSKLKETTARLGNIQYKGDIGGSGNSLYADGTLTSGIGAASFRLKQDGTRINAHLDTKGLDIGRLTGNSKFGTLATTVDVSCKRNGKAFSNIRVDGKFPRIDYNGYSYTNIIANGVYDKTSFNGTLGMDDPNGQISVSGDMQLGKAIQTANINAEIRRLDLAALKITDKWKGAKFDLDISADTHVSDTEDNLFRGRIGIKDLSMYSDEKEYTLDSITVTAENGRMTMRSDFGHAHLEGRYKLKTIAQSFANLLHSKLPSMFKAGGKTDNEFTLDAVITKSDWINTLLGVPLTFDSPLHITAGVNDSQGTMGMACNADRIAYDGSPYEGISVSATAYGDTISVNGNVKKIMNNGHKLDLVLLADAADDKLITSISWDNNQPKPMKGRLNTETKFVNNGNGKPDIAIDIKPSNVLVNDTAWNVLPANILYSGGDLAIEHFAIEHNRQHIKIDGKATKSSNDSIIIDMQDVDVSYVLGLVNFHSVEFGGHMTGKASVKSMFYEPDVYANIVVNRFTFEQGRLGRLYADVKWNKKDKQIDIDAHADDTDKSRTIINGYVSPAENRIDLGITAEDTNIEFLKSFCGNFMDNIRAKANGKVRVHGPLNAINLTGTLVADGKVLVTPINVEYTLAGDTIRFMPDNIVFRSDTIRDRNGNIGIINGALHHEHLSRLTYDISIDTKNLLCYDTKSYGNDTFYGTAYGTGTCTISGRNGRIDIDIDITPDKNSFIEYNATSPETIADQQFITWHDKTSYHTATDSTEINRHADEHNTQPVGDIPSDMRINFLINMTPEASLRVLMDQNTNDRISLNGNGTIRAEYFNKGSFDMFGTFLIDHGTYTLTIQNIIKKVFQFKQGSTIIFGGDPYNALLDLQAIYTVNSVPLSDLQLGNSFTSNNVRVDCLMNISGTPQSPRVDFNIDMPTVNEDAEQMVRTVINSEEEMNQQVVYLLSVGRFYMPGNNNSNDQNRQNQTSLAMQSLLSGTISQQINTILGNLVKNNNWTFGANISTGDEGFNNAEYEGLLSGRLLNNRLIINGQFGYRDNKNATTSFIGDFDINYLLLPNGNIALKVYNQTNDRYFTKSSLNTQGIGLILKKDFNSLMELFGLKRKRKPTIQTTKEK